MGREYGVGVRIVLIAVLAAAGLSVGFLRSAPKAIRAGENLGETAFPLGNFSLKERSGKEITQADLAGKVWIASFIFTRCPLSCPRITTVMKGLQSKVANRNVQLVSISVDPEFDKPEILRLYADKFGADPDRWWFLTGDPEDITKLILERFKLSVSTSTPEERQGGAEAILHSDRLALVDGLNLVGLFDSNDPEALERLVEEASRRARPAWLSLLPTVNATLNGLCAILLVVGLLRIRSKRELGSASLTAELIDQPRVQQHKNTMIAAVVTSAVFLGCYLVYHYFAGSVAFRGQGTIRLVYFTILISHTVLATFGVVPLVTLTMLRALKGDFARHSRIAKITFPIWFYVSITGVVIYLMLYQMPMANSVALPG